MLLQVEKLHFFRGKRQILDDISLSLAEGELLTLLGANGAGKSTLLNCIAGLLTPESGQIYLQNCKIDRLNAKQIAQQVAYISQHSPQTYQYSVKDYVVMGRASHLGLFDKPNQADYALVEDALQRMEIAHLIDATYMNLSGGQKQMVNIARMLVQLPKLILFDEPTSALDYGNIFKVLQLVKSLVEQQFSVVMTTHNPEHPILLQKTLPESKTALLTQSGKLLVGRTDEIITEANLTALYPQANLRLFEVPSLHRNVCTIANL